VIPERIDVQLQPTMRFERQFGAEAFADAREQVWQQVDDAHVEARGRWHDARS